MNSSTQQKESGKPKIELNTQEEKDAFIKELKSARGKIEFPANPSLFPVSITIAKTN